MDADRALLAAAEAIADGASPDWNALESSGSDRERAIAAQLHVVARVAAFRAAPPTAPDHWGGLTVTEKIGAGMFGDVYRARDAHLDRDVALKLLRAEASIEEGRLLARVRHPNVVTIYGADRVDGRLGLWMELIEGRTLKDIAADRGSFSAAEAAQMGLDICRALAAVHGAGLLHRDIKAQNVMREDGGRIVLMDFGVGHDVSDPVRADSDPAETGFAGTPAYVAPEVLKGRPPSIASDIYSVGVLLFHLVTGCFPTPGATLDRIRESHERGERTRLRDVRPDLPTRFVELVEKALSADPVARFQTAGTMEEALASFLQAPHGRSIAAALTSPRTLAILGVPVVLVATVLAALAPWRASSSPAVPPPSPERSLAVLPVEDLTQDPELEYLVDGITESVIRELSAVAGLRVTSRTSSMYFKGRPRTMADIRRQLNVDYAVEMSLRRIGDELDVQMTLIDARSDRSLWTRRFDEPRSKPARLEADVASELLRRMNRASAAPQRAVDAAAYEWYLKGRYQWNKRSAEGLRAARDDFDKAIEADPTYALAHAGLSEAYLLLGAFSWMPQAEASPRAEAAARRALELDPNLSSPHGVIGYLLTNRGEYSAAFNEYLRAIELDPNNVTARQWYALSLMAWNPSEAVRQIELARNLDPLSKVICSDAAVVYKHAGNRDEAIAQLKRTIEIYPDFAEGYIQLGNLYEERGDAAAAASVFERAIELGDDQAYVLAAAVYNQAAAADMKRARSTLQKLERLARRSYVPHGALAIGYASIGDRERAKAYLRHGPSRGDLGTAITEAGRKPGLRWLMNFGGSLAAASR